MPRLISIGIDLGSENTRVIAGEFIKGEKYPKIIALGEAKSAGIRHGYVTDPELARGPLESALAQIENVTGLKVKNALVGLRGATLRADASSGVAMVGKADGEVTALDLKKAGEESEDNLTLGNRKLIHLYPLSYRLDGKEVAGRIEGMRGTKLEAKILFVTYSSQHLEDLLDTVALAKVESTDVIATTIAAGNLVLSDKQKIVGTALIDIGAETTTLAVYENGSLLSLSSFPFGSADITNDIALGFKIPLEHAERLKMGEITPEFSRKKLEEIIEARLTDIFELIENHLKKIKRSELLPAGVVFIGGAANTPGLIEFSKNTLKLPSRIGSSEIFGNSKTKLRDPAWLPVLSLIVSGEESAHESAGAFSSFFKDVKNTLRPFLRQLMP